MTKSFLIIILLLLLIFGVYWKFFLPGSRVATDFPLVLDNQIKLLIDLPRIWSEGGAEGLGEYSVFFLWAWPVSFIIGILANFGVTFSVLEKLFLIVPTLTIGIYGIFKITKSLNFSRSTQFLCALFYLTNTYILLLVDGGQLSIALTYAFFPISFYAVDISLTGRIKEKILAGVAASVLGFLDIRFIYILLLVFIIKFFYQFLYLDKKGVRKWILGWLQTGMAVGLIVLGLNFYWLLPILKDPTSKTAYAIFTQFFSSNLNLSYPFFLISPHWYKNIFGVISPLRWEFVLIPILVFLAPILKPKDKNLGFWLLIALISIFLTKGDAQPFFSFYHWLFNNLPYFSVFRDPTKFFVLVALSYTVLLGYSIEGIKQKIKAKKLKIALFSFTVLYLLFLVHPVWLGWMTGTFSRSYYQKEYQKLRGILQQDTGFSRIFWIPSFSPLGYLSQNHPRIEATRLVQQRPIAVGTVGSYEFINFLREAPYMGEIFDVAGIGYIVYPPLDPRRDDMHPDNIKYYNLFASQLSKLPWLSKVDSPVLLFKTKKHQDKFFAVSNVWWVIGSDSVYADATKSARLKLSDNALIFAEENVDIARKIDQIPEAKIVLNNKTILDLAASFIDPEDLLFPALRLEYEPDASGWWKRTALDLIKWRSFLQEKYGIDSQDFDLGGGWAVGEGDLKFEIRNSKFEKDKVLLARVMESSRSGNLKFYQENSLIGGVDTKTDNSNVRWHEIGQLKDGSRLTIISSGDINVINALAVLDKALWEGYKYKADKLKYRIKDFSIENTLLSSATVSYKKINPTKYLMNVSNIKEPIFLVFSQNYHKLWKINGQSPFPVYSLLNGFRIEKAGEYVVEFEPQKYIYPGLWISGLSLMIIIFFLLI